MSKVLIVYDDRTMVSLLKILLEMDGFEVVNVSIGGQLLNKVRIEKPDLILMDLSLPVIDGWEAARRLKANNDLKHIPVIALTAHVMIGDEDRARECGCDDYLTKPLDEDLLFEKLNRFLGTDA